MLDLFGLKLPPSKEKSVVGVGLASSIKDLVHACTVRDPAVPSTEAEALVARARKMLVSLGGEGATSVDDEAAARTLRAEMAAAHRKLLFDHKRHLAAAAEATMSQCRAMATALKLPIDPKRWADVDQAIAEFLTMAFIGPTRGIDALLDALVVEVDFEASIRDSDKKRLPLKPDELAAHDGVVSRDKVQELLSLVKPGKVSMEPGPMGIADPHYDRSSYPAVEVVQSGETYKLKTVQAQEKAAHLCSIQPIGEIVFGRISMVHEHLDEVVVDPPGGALGFTYSVTGAKADWVGKWFKRGISANAYKEIEKRELEHLVDFSYAFQLAAGTLAEAVNLVAAREFESESAPRDALVAELSKGPGVALIPSDPHSPEAWLDRMTLVLMHLSGFSKDRDTVPPKTHCPIGNTAEIEADAVIIRPLFGTDMLQTKNIIRLERVAPAKVGGKKEEDKSEPPVVAAVAAQPAARPRPDVTKGVKLKIARAVYSLDICWAVDGPQEDGAGMDEGAEVTIESAPLGDPSSGVEIEVWVSADYKQLKLNSPPPDGSLGYFKVRVVDLA